MIAGLFCLAGLFGLAGLLWLGPVGQGELHTGDWTIDDGETVTVTDQIEELEGNLTVLGNLTLDNVTLSFKEPHHNLVVESGGLLELIGGSVEAQGQIRYNATIRGEMTATGTHLSGFNNAWIVDEDASVDLSDVTLDGTGEIWGLKAKYAGQLRLDGVNFTGMSDTAMVTYGNPGWVTNAQYDMGPLAVEQEHYFAATMELEEDDGVDLTGNALQILGGNDEIAVVKFWTEGELDLEVPSWTRINELVNVSHGPYSYRISWPLKEGGSSAITWGRMIWEEDLAWSAQGPTSPLVVTLRNPTLDFTLTQVKVKTTNPTKWEDLIIMAVINNPNPVYVNEMNIGLYYNSLPMTWAQVTDLEPQGSQAFNVTWDSVHMSGDLKLTLKIDPNSKISQWTGRIDRDESVDVSIGSSTPPEDDNPAWWIAALVLLFLAGLIIYAVMTNLKLVEGLKSEDEGDLEARERRLAEREREFQRKELQAEETGPDTDMDLDEADGEPEEQDPEGTEGADGSGEAEDDIDPLDLPNEPLEPGSSTEPDPAGEREADETRPHE